jgi:acetolactate synthase-1/2/3 large subunit
MGYGKRLPQAAKVVQIDMSYATVGKNRDIDLGLVGDPGAILAEVTKAVRNGKASGADKRNAWLEQLRGEEKRLVEERLPRLQKDTAPIHPLRLAHEINQALTDNTMYIGDGGDVVTFSGGVVQPHGPGLWMDPGPLGTIGVGMPFVLGAKQARPDREIIALFGDGSFSLTGWDFETAIRYDLPFIGIIGNNSYMNQIRYGQIAKYGEEMGDVGVKLGDVKYDEFAKMLGGYGEEVREPKDIRPAIERARESGKPALINVWIDPNAFAPGTMNQTMYK